MATESEKQTDPYVINEFRQELLLLLIAQGRYDEAHDLIDRYAARVDYEMQVAR